jgi:Helix-turn-helix domain
MPEQRSTSAAGQVSLEVGQPFNPFKLFNGIFIPDALVLARGISAAAKITYGRLARYAGEDGECYPAVGTLAHEIGMGERQTQRYLAELERNLLIRRLARVSESGQSSNEFVFLWHPIFAIATTKVTPKGVSDRSPGAATEVSPKESQSEESQFEEKTTNKRISGYALPKSRSAASLPVMCFQDLEIEPSKAEAEPDAFADLDSLEGEGPPNGWTSDELATVRSRIVLYWRREPEEGFEVSVMLRVRGASAAAVCELLDRKFKNKNLRVGGKWAPKSQNWFLTMIENEFKPGHLPEPPTLAGSDQQRVDSGILERGIEAIELVDAPRSIVESVRCNDCGGAALIRYTDGTIKGCACRQKPHGELKGVPASGAPGSHSSAGAGRRSASR